MTELVIGALARNDAISVLRAIAETSGPRAVDRYASEFDACFTRLVAHPRSCALDPSLGSRIRKAVVNPYVIVYRYEQRAGRVVILRLFHGRQHITAKRLS